MYFSKCAGKSIWDILENVEEKEIERYISELNLFYKSNKTKYPSWKLF